MDKFVDREAELDYLQTEYTRRGSALVVLYGRRRVGKTTLLTEFMRGKRILIVDDVISTGESLKAVEELVEKAGGIIAGRAFILAEGDACERDDVIFLAPLPLFNADGTQKK